MASITKNAKKLGGKVFYGWWIVFFSSVLAGLGTGSVFYGFSTFFNPMIAEFGWSRTVTAGAFSLSRLEGGFEGLIIGPLIDKFGARAVAIVGVIGAGLGFIALLLVNNNPLTLYILFGVFLSLGYNCFSQRATIAAAAKWFIRKRSRALSFVVAGSGVGGAIGVPVLAWLITNYGWRTAAVVAGIVIMVVGLPVSMGLRNTPEEYGLLPDGEKPSKAEEEAQAAARSQGSKARSTRKEIDFTLKETLKTSAFWFYSLGLLFRSFVLSAIVVHEIPYLTDMGIDYTAAAGILGLMVLISIPGRLFFGWLGDFMDKRIILFGTCMLQAVGIWIFINATSLGMLYVFVTVYGLGYGGVMPAMRAIQGDLWGRKSYATIAGVTNIFTSIGTIAAPVIAGLMYDSTHSYILAFTGLMISIAIAGVAFALIRHPKPPARLAGI